MSQPSPLPARRFTRIGWLWGLVWLFYLIPAANAASQLEHPVRRAVALAAIVTFALLFTVSFVQRRRSQSERRRVPVAAAVVLVAAGVGLVVMITALLGHETLALFVYVGVMAVFLLPRLWGPAVVLALIAGTFVAEQLRPNWDSNGSVQLQIFAAGLAMWGVMQIVSRNVQLAAAREEIAELAVREERNRLARDMHDILGHSLTVVSVKAELAARLVRLDPERAEAEMEEVQRLSRQALAEVRATVGGYREVTLTGELASARAALAAAGIEAELPTPEVVPEDRRELFGWVIREGVTNVIRHSGASHCRVTLTPSTVEVSDDGRGPSPGDSGHGLDGLRQRVRAAGGTLTAGPGPQGGFRLRATL